MARIIKSYILYIALHSAQPNNMANSANRKNFISHSAARGCNLLMQFMKLLLGDLSNGALSFSFEIPVDECNFKIYFWYRITFKSSDI